VTPEINYETKLFADPGECGGDLSGRNVDWLCDGKDDIDELPYRC
jgi:hypothetical protein